MALERVTALLTRIRKSWHELTIGTQDVPVPHLQQQLVLDEIRAQFEAFAKSRDPKQLERALPIIYDSHRQISWEQAQAFRKTLDKVARGCGTVLELYEWLKQNTAMRDCAIGDEWDLAGKGEKGDGVWGRRSKGKDGLGLSINRDDHMIQMVLAGQDILREEYQYLYEYAYQNMVPVGLEVIQPNLTRGMLERNLPILSQKNLLPEMRKLVYLGMVLHDYGRLLKDKVKVDPKDTRPDADWHRIAGSHLADDLLLKLGFDKFQVEIVKLLIRQHDAIWNLYCLGKYGEERSALTTPQSVEYDIRSTLAGLEKSGMLPAGMIRAEIKKMLWKMIAVIGIADVYASGNRYLSDSFVANVIPRVV